MAGSGAASHDGPPAGPAGPEPHLIVFLHGYLGPILGLNALYWYGLRRLHTALRREGHTILLARSIAAAAVEDRAARAWASIPSTGPRPIVLVGHSMGGLDARWMAARLDDGRRVRAVVTLGAPHRGSPLADVALTENALLYRALRLIERGALAALTPGACALFNDAVPDRSDVLYLSLAGSRPADEMPWPLARGLARRLEDLAGPNDGQVPLASARWGYEPVDCRADHFELIGLSLRRADAAIQRPFDHAPVLRRLLDAALAPRGDEDHSRRS